jgi:hypothetical protein
MPRRLAHAWKNSGAETARVLFLYTPAGAGGFFEESQRLQRAPTSRSLPKTSEPHIGAIAGRSSGRRRFDRVQLFSPRDIARGDFSRGRLARNSWVVALDPLG